MARAREEKDYNTPPYTCIVYGVCYFKRRGQRTRQELFKRAPQQENLDLYTADWSSVAETLDCVPPMVDEARFICIDSRCCKIRLPFPTEYTTASWRQQPAGTLLVANHIRHNHSRDDVACLAWLIAHLRLSSCNLGHRFSCECARVCARVCVRLCVRACEAPTRVTIWELKMC